MLAVVVERERGGRDREPGIVLQVGPVELDELA